MSEQGFTPGPWGIEQTTTVNWIGPLRKDGKVNRIIANTDRKGLVPESLARNDANARLIAAAPELLEALIDCLGMAEAWREDRPGEDIDQAFSKAQELIKRVKGEN